MENLKRKIDELKQKAQGLKAEQIIQLAYEEFGRRVNFASSLGEEDQVITDMIAKAAPAIEVFTLDTERLFPETYDLIEKIKRRYPLNFKIYYPDSKAVAEMVNDKGLNLFYESVDNRKLCCGIRKVEPLNRALRDVDAWITGLRRAQSLTRMNVEALEWDEEHQKIKINPLVNWTLDEVHKYIRENHVPVNSLHAKGFVSIGCASCTRAVRPGEDIRAGRWWWETPESKECGLHVHPPKLNTKVI